MQPQIDMRCNIGYTFRTDLGIKKGRQGVTPDGPYFYSDPARWVAERGTNRFVSRGSKPHSRRLVKLGFSIRRAALLRD